MLGLGFGGDGSPPRVWGIRVCTLRVVCCQRFTPTRVGNTHLREMSSRPSPVHPHACGEYCACVTTCAHYTGSPPRVWGIPAAVSRNDSVSRFTPTRVGNTPIQRRRYCTRAVHPHACGEYHDGVCVILVQPGSPPRVWGIRLRTLGGERCRRFTPTRVGNTQWWLCAAGGISVHPHACGEYVELLCLVPGHFGSPPRVWGIRVPTIFANPPQRFTPTRVGNTRASIASIAYIAVHPHACGEYLFCLRQSVL